MLGKETDDHLKDVYKRINDQRSVVRSSPISITHLDTTYTVHINLKMSMLDGKMRALLSGLGGAFCMLCTCSRDEASSLVDTFTINRTTEQVVQIWYKMCSGEIVKKPHDQAVRQGVTQEPIVELESVASMSPLHSQLRFFDFLLKIIYCLNAGLFNWSNEQTVLGASYRFLKESKDVVRSAIRDQTGVAIDIPDATGKGGTSTSGNTIHTLLSQERNIEVLRSLVPERFQEALHDCITRSYVITKLYNSTYKIDVDAYKEFCVDTKKKLLTSFNGNARSWIYLTPTVHGVLEHAWELVEANEEKGLMAYTESSLECNNKILRLMRVALSKKTNQMENLTDCLNRLWIRSDIHVRDAVPPKKSIKRVDTVKSNINRDFQGPLISKADYYIRDLLLE